MRVSSAIAIAGCSYCVCTGLPATLFWVLSERLDDQGTYSAGEVLSEVLAAPVLPLILHSSVLGGVFLVLLAILLTDLFCRSRSFWKRAAVAAVAFLLYPATILGTCLAVEHDVGPAATILPLFVCAPFWLIGSVEVYWAVWTGEPQIGQWWAGRSEFAAYVSLASWGFLWMGMFVFLVLQEWIRRRRARGIG